MSVEQFQALAKSSPWRFRRLTFTHTRSSGERTEAELTRPGHLKTVVNGGAHISEGLPYSSTTFTFDGSPTQEWVPVLPHTVKPTVRADGLVLDRPEADYDDPLWNSFDWVAMLDPVELSDGVVIDEVTETERHGRRTLWASISDVTDDYEPRCSCCALLWGEETARLLADEGGPSVADEQFATSWLVGLDWETGIVVSLEPIGGNRTDLGFTVDIPAVEPW